MQGSIRFDMRIDNDKDEHKIDAFSIRHSVFVLAWCVDSLSARLKCLLHVSKSCHWDCFAAGMGNN